ASAPFTNIKRIAPGKYGSGAIPQLSPRCYGQKEPKMAKRSIISFGLATPMFGPRLAGAMSWPKPRPVSLRRLELGVACVLVPVPERQRAGAHQNASRI